MGAAKGWRGYGLIGAECGGLMPPRPILPCSSERALCAKATLLMPPVVTTPTIPVRPSQIIVFMTRGASIDDGTPKTPRGSAAAVQPGWPHFLVLDEER